MKKKASFQRVTIDDMRALKTEQMVGEFLSKLDEVIDEEVEELAQSLVDNGYDVDDFEIEVQNNWQDGKLIVNLNVVQIGKTLEFSLVDAS
jgi:predicted methyltransferase MtxX (methanogen marker protein 4)